MKRPPKVLWVILAVFAFAKGAGGLRHLLPNVPFPAELDNFIHRRVALSLHAVGGAIALMAGPLQFLARLRESNWNRHRLLGWIYCGGVLLGWCASLWIAQNAQTGWIAASGFLTLGAAWIATTALAARFIWRGDALQHRRWMIHSYALTAAITLRLYLPLVFAFHWSLAVAYPAIAWLCWVPNVVAAELYLRYVPTPSGTSLPARLIDSFPELS